MREIEFRGKRVDNGEWVYGLPMYMNYIKEFTKHEWIDNLDNNKVKEYQTTADFQIEGETLGQYTGLKDKNGTKIFEGDIVRCKKMGNEHIVIVEWSNLFAGYYLRFTDKPIGLCELCFAEDIEVIGNIYDNPELLEDIRSENK